MVSNYYFQAKQTYAEKLQNAEKRHGEYIKTIKEKAGEESTKVSEINFINTFNELVLKDQLNERLNEVENRILAGRQRREQILAGIKDKRRF